MSEDEWGCIHSTTRQSMSARAHAHRGPHAVTCPIVKRLATIHLALNTINIKQTNNQCAPCSRREESHPTGTHARVFDTGVLLHTPLEQASAIFVSQPFTIVYHAHDHVAVRQSRHRCSLRAGALFGFILSLLNGDNACLPQGCLAQFGSPDRLLSHRGAGSSPGGEAARVGGLEH